MQLNQSNPYKDELVNGIRIVSRAAPHYNHGVLIRLLGNNIEDNLDYPCRVALDCLDVKFDNNNIRQPDISVINVEDTFEGTVYTGKIKLVVEIWSPENKRSEREEKINLYKSNSINQTL
ncbi:MAG: hypothetical protein ATN35_10705 [Epulopiscium sp. Nele67-Bin004]|nr:MAG: hypothetical protein ATN35_10705 [Epulopiscium sp. Nele67-Bin004]